MTVEVANQSGCATPRVTFGSGEGPGHGDTVSPSDDAGDGPAPLALGSRAAPAAGDILRRDIAKKSRNGRFLSCIAAWARI